MQSSSINQKYNLNWLDNLSIRQEKGNGTIIREEVTAACLNGTPFYCTNDSDAGKWEHRITFIKEVITDVLDNCPKDQPLVFVSLGSAKLLMEFLTAKALIENNFEDIYFYLIDPSYVFGTSKNLEVSRTLRLKFIELTKAAYFDKWKKMLPEGNLKFLSRAQNLSKYFPKGANVVLIESLPPYAEIVKGIKVNKQIRQIDRKPKEYFAGSKFVDQPHANSLAFFQRTVSN